MVIDTVEATSNLNDLVSFVSKSGKTYDVCILYAPEDENYVGRLVRYLEDRELKSQKLDIHRSDISAQVILNIEDSCAAVLVVLSRSFLKSRPCKRLLKMCEDPIVEKSVRAFRLMLDDDIAEDTLPQFLKGTSEIKKIHFDCETADEKENVDPHGECGSAGGCDAPSQPDVLSGQTNDNASQNRRNDSTTLSLKNEHGENNNQEICCHGDRQLLLPEDDESPETGCGDVAQSGFSEDLRGQASGSTGDLKILNLIQWAGSNNTQTVHCYGNAYVQSVTEGASAVLAEEGWKRRDGEYSLTTKLRFTGIDQRTGEQVDEIVARSCMTIQHLDGVEEHVKPAKIGLGCIEIVWVSDDAEAMQRFKEKLLSGELNDELLAALTVDEKVKKLLSGQDVSLEVSIVGDIGIKGVTVSKEYHFGILCAPGQLEFAHDLADHLEKQAGLNVLLPHRDFIPGSSVFEEIWDMPNRCSSVVVLMSNDLLRSRQYGLFSACIEQFERRGSKVYQVLLGEPLNESLVPHLPTSLTTIDCTWSALQRRALADVATAITKHTGGVIGQGKGTEMVKCEGLDEPVSKYPGQTGKVAGHLRVGSHDDETRKYRYDAFVIYSLKDVHWVHDVLSKTLEQEDDRFELCLHNRDFPLATPIEDSVIEAIHGSRYTIMVISKNFLGSEWCVFEMHMALQVFRTRQKSIVIPIILEDIPMQDAPPTLSNLLNTRTHLRWDPDDVMCQNAFWEKLKEVLRIKPDLTAQKVD